MRLLCHLEVQDQHRNDVVRPPILEETVLILLLVSLGVRVEIFFRWWLREGLVRGLDEAEEMVGLKARTSILGQ